MVIRRIRDHVHAHNWFAVGIDLAIVVVGVFLGMQANNWNEARIDRQRGQEYRQRLIDDLDANQQDFQQRAAYYRDVHDAGYAALQDLRRLQSADPIEFLFNAYKATSILPRSTQRATYQEILSAGATGTLGDEAIRQQIANYYFGLDTTTAAIATLPPYRDRLRSGMPYEVQRAIRSDCPEINRDDAKGRPGIALGVDCRPKLNSAAALSAALQVRSIPDLQFDLTRSLVDDDQKILQFQTMEHSAGKLRAVLEATVPHRGER
jgi:hypothetical protein